MGNKPLTAQERAENIVKTRLGRYPLDPGDRALISDIVTEIQAAENIAAAGMQTTMKEMANRWVDAAYKRGVEDGMKKFLKGTRTYTSHDYAHDRELVNHMSEKIRAEEREECAKIADNDADPAHGRLCVDPIHDDRYCGTCEAMRDEADVLGQRIRSRGGETFNVQSGMFQMLICECGDKESGHKENTGSCARCDCQKFKERRVGEEKR